MLMGRKLFIEAWATFHKAEEKMTLPQPTSINSQSFLREGMRPHPYDEILIDPILFMHAKATSCSVHSFFGT